MSRNATERATESNPAEPGISVSASLLDALGPEAARLPPALAKRVAEVIASNSTGAGASNEPSDKGAAFFRALGYQRHMAGSMGGSWSNLRHPQRLPCRLNAVDAALSGIAGVTEVLIASEAARCAGEDGLGENLTDRLFYALRALSNHARDELEEGRKAAEGGRE